MPHLVLEYTRPLKAVVATPDALLKLNQALLDLGEFQEADIKSRTVPLENYRVGVNQENREFVHVTVSILHGRSAEIKRKLSQSLLEVLNSIMTAASCAALLSVQIADIDRESYLKVRVGS